MNKIGNVANMGEKKGNTGKLKYDFNTAANLEIEYKQECWIRVTPTEFRAFSGSRRINSIEYTGPVYIFNTNKIADSSEKIGLQFVDDKDPRIFKKMLHEQSW
jgi:hypothetical protein